MLYKTTKKLFRGVYQYKIVLVCAGSNLFRNNDMEAVLEELSSIDLNSKKLTWKSNFIKTQSDLDYTFQLQSALSKITDIEIRVESPWISIYSNNKADIDALASIDADHVKYVCIPPTHNSLDVNTIIMPKMDYEYRVTLGKTTQEHSAFIAWAQGNKKCKLTKSCIRDLNKSRTWGGTHFYITGDNNLLLAKMHLGGSISKVERIVKA
jgi:hypothetical protein